MRLGYVFGLLSFLGLCAAALFSPLSPDTVFSGAVGIEDDIAETARAVVADIDGATVEADGRDLILTLPEVLPAGVDREAIRARLLQDDGVRSLSITGGTATALPEPTEVPEPEPTATDVPEPEPTPTSVPEPAPTATDVPAPAPTATDVPEPTATPVPEPAPTATATPEPTEVPEPDPTATPEAPSAAEIVAGLELDGIEFAADSARLTATDTAILDAVADQLRGLDGGQIEVQVHTDSVGDPDAKLLLSQTRAEAVRDYLIDQGVDPSLLSARGYGASRPIASNSTEQGREANRRVALVVEGN